MAASVNRFYPPRARWFSGWWNAVFALRQSWHLDRFRPPVRISTGRFLLAVALPGYAYRAFGRKWSGWLVMGGYAVLMAVFLVWLGHRASNLAMGAMISLHVISLLHLISRWPTELDARSRICLPFAVLATVGLLIYLPLRGLMERHAFMPLDIRGRIVVVAAHTAPVSVQRGDLIAFHVTPTRERGILTGGGIGLERVEAMPGEHIRFGAERYTIGGTSRPLRIGMPRNQEWVVPEKRWFVWPDSSIELHGNAANMTRAFSNLAFVTESQLVGKPYARWFGRNQLSP